MHGLGYILTKGSLQTGRQGADQSLSEVLVHKDIEHWVEVAVEEDQGACFINKDMKNFVLTLQEYLFEPDCNQLKGEPTEKKGSHNSSKGQLD